MPHSHSQESGLSESECNAHWLDKHIAEQSCNASLISSAAKAVEMFSEDELEDYANQLRCASSVAYQL